MEFLSDVFVKFWKEAIVAVLLTAVLPFIRRYVRRQRAKMINFFREKKRLEQNLSEAEGKLRESQEEAERLRSELNEERNAREELERRNLKFQSEIKSLRDELIREQKAHEESERLRQVEAEENRKAQEEAERLLNVAKEAERFRAEEWRKAQNEADSLREELTREQKAHQAETEEKLKAQSEIERLKYKPEPKPKKAELNPEAHYELGKKYYEEKNYEQAADCYLVAAEHGYVKAQTELAAMYYYGIGVRADKSEAVKWYRKVAEQGDSEARFMLQYLHQ